MKMITEEMEKLMSVHNLSMSDLGKMLGVSRMQVWRMLNNRSNAGMTVITGFRKAFPNEVFDNYFTTECE